MKKPLTAVIIFLLILTVSCRKMPKEAGVTTGRIDYKITYLNQNLDNKTRNILPSHMKLLFNEKEASNNIEGFMGMYKLHAFTDFHTRKCSTILKVLDKHYFFKGSRDEPMCCFDTMEDMVLQETKETKMIAGFLCKKAMVYLPSSKDTFSIYYTDQIALKHPNITNPYKEVKGVLMEFELKLLYLEMRFVAEKYQPLEQIDFNPRINTASKQVSRNQMTRILNKLME